MEVIAAMADRGVHVSHYQLERWRAAGLIPRNVRHGLGRGSGSTSRPAPQMLSCVEAVARASISRSDIGRHILGGLYESVFRPSWGDLVAPEQPLRRAFEMVLERDRHPPVPEDDAYLIAETEARGDESVAASLRHWSRRPMALGIRTPRMLQQFRRSYEHVLAARHIGVSAVGRDILEESVVNLGWATGGTSHQVVDYLDLVLGRYDDHVMTVRTADYGHIVETGRLGSHLLSYATHAPDLLLNTALSWLPDLRYEYAHYWQVHVALLINSDLSSSATDFVKTHPQDPLSFRRSRTPAGRPVADASVMS